MRFTRRQFVRSVPSLGLFVLPPSQAAVEEPVWPTLPAPGAPPDESFPSQHAAHAKEIVGAAHRNLARVRELVQQRPSLAKAAWDWGFGDWETALGAASHTGQRAIAELLLDNGAPPTIFSAAMLGQLEVVKGFGASIPGVQRLRGPHGITLTAHARAGAAQAADVLRYLESLGSDQPYVDTPLSAADRSALEGRYTFGPGARDHFLIETRQNRLGITRAGATRLNLFHVGDLQFHPAGAPAVRIRFERDGDRAIGLSVLDPDVVVRARQTMS